MKRFVFLTVTAIAMVLGGCSFNKEFAKSVSEQVDQFQPKMDGYIAAMPPGPAKDAEADRFSRFVLAVHAGDRPTVLPLWFDVPGVRDSFSRFLRDDPYHSTPVGLIKIQEYYKNIQVLDYQIAIGPKTSTATRPPPVLPPPPARPVNPAAPTNPT